MHSMGLNAIVVNQISSCNRQLRFDWDPMGFEWRMIKHDMGNLRVCIPGLWGADHILSIGLRPLGPLRTHFGNHPELANQIVIAWSRLPYSFQNGR